MTERPQAPKDTGGEAPTGATGEQERFPSFLFGMALGLLIGYYLVAPRRAAPPPRRRPTEQRPPQQPIVRAEPPLVWRDRSDVFRPSPAGEVPADCLIWLGGNGVRVAIGRAAWRAMEEYTRGDVRRERLGLLIGSVAKDGQENRLLTVVTEAVPLHSSNASGTHVALTGEAAPRIAEAMRQLPEDATVVGWFHSHPGLGVFLSGTDLRTQCAHFSQEWQVAVVLDPVGKQGGVFIGPHGVPARRAGNLRR